MNAEFFFGRETFVEGLVKVAQQQPIVAVIGSSGSGKSSVVLAGLIPKLREEGSWLIESFRPNKQPFYELAAALVSQLEPELGKTDKTIKAKELAESIRKHGFTADVSAILKDKPGSRLLLVVDQFEELYTGCVDTEQQQFVDAVLAAVESTSLRLTLVLTLRADFYSYVVNYPPFGEALNKYPAQNLTLMKAEEMHSAIELPAEKMGVKLEEGLTQLILKDVKQEPGNLPLLEFALTQLWEKQNRGQLTHQAYSEIGGVAKALSNHAEAVYGKLSEEDKKQAQRIFLQLVRPGEGTEDTRRVATRGEVGNWDLVTRLADARLVVTGRNEQTEEETVEVVHESLIREWQTLRQWVEDNRSFRTWQERLEGSRRQWELTGKDDGALLRGVPLVEAESWQDERLAELSERQRIFIQLSLALRDMEKKERESQQQRITIARTLAICFLIAFLGLVVFFFRDRINREFMSANKKHLAGSNLAKKYLPGVDLSDGNLSQANLSEAYIDGSDLSRAKLNNANLVKTYMRKVRLQDADLSQANLSGADIDGSNLSRAKLNGASFIKTYMPKTQLQNTDLSQANLSEAYMDGSNLSKAKLNKANLVKTYIRQSRLQDADLSQANLSGADIDGSDFSRAKLNGVSFIKTYMPKTQLQNADLSQANLSEAYIDGADLSGANLQGAKNLNPDQVKRAKNWEKAKYDEEFRKKLGLK
jgi:uncharacterized protein YjbI with pentapeptide repeats